MTSKKEEEKKEEKQEEKKPVMKTVRTVSSRGKGAVVEWVDNGVAFRKIVPISKIKGNKIDEETLDKSPDYGVPWAKELNPDASAEDLEKALHNAGVWTAEDAMKSPQAVIGAINTAYKSDLVAILKAAKKHRNKE